MKLGSRKYSIIVGLLTLASALSFSTVSFAEVKTLGQSFSANGVTVEISSAEVFNEDERSLSIEGLTSDIVRDRESNPESIVELAWLDIEADGRSPAQLQKLASRSRTFVQDIFSRLKAKNVNADKALGIAIPAAKVKKDSWYLNHSKLSWTVIRVTNSTGLKVASLIFVGLSPLHAIEVGSAVAVACTLASSFYIPINNFANNVRYLPLNKISNGLHKISQKLNLQKYPKIQNALQKSGQPETLDNIHQSFNWGLAEVAFGAVVIGGGNLVREILGLSMETPSLLDWTGGTLLAIKTQGVWDRAVGKYQALEDLMQKHEGLDVNDPMYIKIRNANIYKQGAIGSIMSVVGFTWSGSHDLRLKVSGYVILGSLGVMGHIYERRIDAKTAKFLAEIDVCNTVLSGKNPKIFDQAG